jgi:hypothetical protein
VIHWAFQCFIPLSREIHLVRKPKFRKIGRNLFAVLRVLNIPVENQSPATAFSGAGNFLAGLFSKFPRSEFPIASRSAHRNFQKHRFNGDSLSFTPCFTASPGDSGA